MALAGWLLALLARLPARVRASLAGVLATVVLSLWFSRGQVDAVLQQLHLPGAAGGGAAGLPIGLPGPVAVSLRAQLQSWADVVAAGADTRLRSPGQLVLTVEILDAAMVLAMALAAGLLLAGLRGWLARTHPTWQARHAMLTAARALLVPAVLVALAHDAIAVLLLRLPEVGAPRGPGLAMAALASLLSLGRVLLGWLVAVPILVVALAWFRDARGVRAAISASRSVLLIVAGLSALALVIGLGADQLDDVVRAWTPTRATLAVAATSLAALVVRSAVIHVAESVPQVRSLTSGRDAQPVLLGGGLLLAAAGGVCWWLNVGWGLLVPAGMLLLLWALGAPLPEVTEPVPAPPVVRSGAAASAVARTAGAAVLVTTATVAARANAFGTLVRSPVDGPLLVRTAVVLGVLIAVGVAATSPNRAADRFAWPSGGVLAVVMLGLAATSVDRAAWLGSWSVLMLGATVLASIAAGLSTVVRSGPARDFQLPRALRVLGLTRFPALTFLLVWVVVVQWVGPDQHEIRRLPAPREPAAPNLTTAWRQFLSAQPEPGGGPTGARPAVFVAAQGGGVRAAVWTASVLECLFGPGPGPVPAGRCPAADGASGNVPVFLASGTSGGGLGVAAWTAQRADAVSGVHDSPSAATAFAGDPLAADVATGLVSDGSRLLLAHSFGDRAQALERAWEQPFKVASGEDGGDGAAGLARGLRATWQATHAGGRWAAPVLALNGLDISSGCRFLASGVRFDGPARQLVSRAGPAGCLPRGADSSGVLARTVQLLDLLCSGQDVPLSTAAHLASRFPYVSPSAIVRRPDCPDAGLPDGTTVQDLDGGLLDNSGASTTLETWTALRAIPTGGTAVLPVLVQIDNAAPAAPTGRETASELEAPLKALAGQVQGRADQARSAAAAAFTAAPWDHGVCADGDQLPAPWFHFVLYAQPGPQPPLGWTLSPTTIADLQAQLASGPNRQAVQQLTTLLTARSLSPATANGC